ncbi:MAG TPA: EamA/RhaT family transporter [Planctomycetaceae bacterium]|nr:EamA/RhaT family transporter [Planctomycetaceae bacterium]
MMLAKQAIEKGASPWTGTFWANVWLGLIALTVCGVRQEFSPVELWGPAAATGALFVAGQLLTYLAFQFGDVSLATPIFGTKVLMVAALQPLVSGKHLSARVWVAGVLATIGVILIQRSGQRSETLSRRQVWLTIGLTLGAAFCLSLFDLFLERWGPHDDSWAAWNHLAAVFAVAMLLSLGFLPKVDSPRRIRELKASRQLLGGTGLMAIQAMSMVYSLSRFGDAARINIVYSLRGLWGVLLAWALASWLNNAEAKLSRSVMLQRLGGAVLLTGALVLAATE